MKYHQTLGPVSEVDPSTARALHGTATVKLRCERANFAEKSNPHDMVIRSMALAVNVVGQAVAAAAWVTGTPGMMGGMAQQVAAPTTVVRHSTSTCPFAVLLQDQMGHYPNAIPQSGCLHA